MIILTPCGCHSLNLCGNDTAECLLKTITYFGTVQTIHNAFIFITKRWELHRTRIGCSLHGMSVTRLSARLKCVKPFDSHHDGMQLALEVLLERNLTAKT